jgi:hypothetical protein
MEQLGQFAAVTRVDLKRVDQPPEAQAQGGPLWIASLELTVLEAL